MKALSHGDSSVEVLLGRLTQTVAGDNSNYTFCADWARIFAPVSNARVLDYGCGAGRIVELMRRNGLDAHGCDVFYAGGDYSASIAPAIQPYIHRMTSELIPFPDGYFDLVISNQVIEHVENLDSVLAEMRRVLRPGGAMLNLFGHRGCWREGHCGIPFLHRFPKRSRLRVYYAALLRKIGLGYHTSGKSAWKWSEDFCDWLDQWTWYRSTQQIRHQFAAHFAENLMIDRTWLGYRMGSVGRLFARLPNAFSAAIVRPAVGLIVLSFASPSSVGVESLERAS